MGRSRMNTSKRWRKKMGKYLKSVIPNRRTDSPVSTNVSLKHHFAFSFQVTTYKLVSVGYPLYFPLFSLLVSGGSLTQSLGSLGPRCPYWNSSSDHVVAVSVKKKKIGTMQEIASFSGVFGHYENLVMVFFVVSNDIFQSFAFLIIHLEGWPNRMDLKIIRGREGVIFVREMNLENGEKGKMLM